MNAVSRHSEKSLVSPNLDRLIRLRDLRELFLGQLAVHTLEQLVQSLVGSDSNDWRGDPRRLKRPRHGDFGHRYTSLFSHLLDSADDFEFRGEGPSTITRKSLVTSWSGLSISRRSTQDYREGQRTIGQSSEGHRADSRPAASGPHGMTPIP